MRGPWLCKFLFLFVAVLAVPAGQHPHPARFRPGARVVLDAHNCYPILNGGPTASTAHFRQALRWRSSRICFGLGILAPAK